jgi:hypothetical protein
MNPMMSAQKIADELGETPPSSAVSLTMSVDNDDARLRLNFTDEPAREIKRTQSRVHEDTTLHINHGNLHA